MTLRRGRVRPKRRTPRRRTAPRWTPEDWTVATVNLLSRDHGSCPRCGDRIRDKAERHHRQRRTVGGDRYANLLLLHPACHQWITEHPTEARERGWIVSAHGADPADVPVVFTGTPVPSVWLLADDGTRERVA